MSRESNCILKKPLMFPDEDGVWLVTVVGMNCTRAITRNEASMLLVNHSEPAFIYLKPFGRPCTGLASSRNRCATYSGALSKDKDPLFRAETRGSASRLEFLPSSTARSRQLLDSMKPSLPSFLVSTRRIISPEYDVMDSFSRILQFLSDPITLVALLWTNSC